MKVLSKEQLFALLKDLDIVKFVTALEDYAHIWDHRSPIIIQKPNKNFIKLARACGTTGKNIY